MIDPDKLSLEEILRTTGWLRRGSKEWKVAWPRLLEKTGDSEYGSWEYMGSDSWTGRWTHYFRNKWHPRGEWRLRVRASEGWTPASEKTARKRRKAAA